MALLDLLREGRVEAFNAARGRHAAPDLFAADLSNLDLRGVDLSGANLEKADLSGCRLDAAVLVQADLSGADLTDASLEGTLALGSRWRGAYLGNVNLEGADLSRADLTGADLTGARGAGVQLVGARMKEAILVDAHLPEADLSQAQLGKADLSRADLTSCKFREAVLSKAVLDGSTAPGADFTLARMAGVTTREARLKGAILREADLTGAVLDGADLEGADLTRADLGSASLEGTRLQGAVLREARLEGVQLPADLQLEEAPPEEDLVAVDAGEPRSLEFDDIRCCVSEGAVGGLWENAEGGGVSRIRVTVGMLDRPWGGPAPALPDPADLVVARALMPTDTGFLALLFVERPGGMVCRVTEVSGQGDLGPSRTVPFDYTPAVRPVFVPDPEGFLVMGLSRRGPTLHVHRFNGSAFDALARERVPTARGFVGGVEPVLLCKGGVVFPVTAAGPGRPVTSPEGFPGRAGAACHVGDGVLLAWIQLTGRGVNWSILRPGGAVEVRRLVPDHAVGSLDVRRVGDRVLVIFTREGEAELEPAGLHACWLTASEPSGAALGNPFPLLPGLDEDLDQVQVVPGAAEPLVAVISAGRGVPVVEVQEAVGVLRTRLGA